MRVLEISIVIILMLATFYVIIDVTADAAERTGKAAAEEACKAVNMFVQGTENDAVNRASLRACRTIDLEALPLKGEKKEDVLKDIGQHIDKTWDIFLKGSKESYFGDNNLWDSEKQCMILYTFTIKKDVGTAIPMGELIQYLKTTPYKVADTSDGCAGSEGGFCKPTCNADERRVKALKTCAPDSKGNAQQCCMPSSVYNSCEAHNGDCLPTQSYPEKIAYPGWNCARNGYSCYVGKKNYQSYLDYVYFDGGTVGFDEAEPLYPQNFRANGEKRAVTYAIVFASRVTQSASIGNSLIHLTLWSNTPGAPTNTNGVILAPLDKVKNACNVQTRDS